jgi:hypothetical protein
VWRFKGSGENEDKRLAATGFTLLTSKIEIKAK